MDQENKSLDVLGIKDYAKPIEKVVDGTVEGASAFLSRICLPAAEEFGLLLKDKVSAWRAENAINMTYKAQLLLEERSKKQTLNAHPRIIYSAIEHGSWSDNDLVQDYWAGILASSCTENDRDESNLIFINLLSQLTSNEAKLIEYICNNVKPTISLAGWINVNSKLCMNIVELQDITQLNDIHQIDRELDHLRNLGLISEGFSYYSAEADVTPTALCLNFYVRCQGYVGTAIDYFDAEEINNDEDRVFTPTVD